MRNLILICLVCFSCVSFAADKVCVNNEPTKCSQPLSTGETAPFDGQLLTPDLAIDLGQKANDFSARLNIEIEHIKKLDKLDLDLEKKLHTIDTQAWATEKDLMMKSLEKMESPSPWYQHPIFVCVVTAISVGLLSYGMYSINNH